LLWSRIASKGKWSMLKKPTVCSDE
jgi:hypothetical protein